MRLRQAVWAARDLEAVARELEGALGVHDPYRDPGVAVFGLSNVVYALGDTFLEVVSPVKEDTTAGRYLEKVGGDSGYMVIVQVDDIDGARSRADALGVRTVWSSDLEDISGTHLHPKDTGGAILSLDHRPPGFLALGRSRMARAIGSRPARGRRAPVARPASTSRAVVGDSGPAG